MGRSKRYNLIHQKVKEKKEGAWGSWNKSNQMKFLYNKNFKTLEKGN